MRALRLLFSERARWWPWGAAALVLYVRGGRFERRAALRGVFGAVLGASAGRALDKALGSAGPPGGSAEVAAAAGFLTGAALEQPWAAVGSAAFGAAPLSARLSKDPVRLAPGAAAGVAAAYATRMPWPVAPHDSPDVRRVRLAPRRQPSADGDGVAIAVNLEAGAQSDGEWLDHVRRDLPRAHIQEIRVEQGHELRAYLEESSGARALGVAGGDGSVNAAAHVAVERSIPLVVFPTGTLNHLARDLGIESVADSVDAVKAGSVAAIDVATIDGRVFLNTASFGSYAELVDARERLEGKIGKWPAVLVALVKVLRRAEPVRVSLDGRDIAVWMAFIGNCRYRPSGFAPTWREELDDGRLDFRFIHASAPWARARLVLAVVTGRLGRCRVYEERVAHQIRVRSLDGVLRLARDGETFDASGDEVIVRKLDDRLQVYVPEPSGAS